MFPTVIPTAPTPRIGSTDSASRARPGEPTPSPQSRSSAASVVLVFITASASRGSSSREPFEQMIADAERIGPERQRGIDCSARGKEAGVDDVEVVELVRLAVRVQRGCLRVVPEPNRAVLVRNAGQRDALAEIETPREQAFVALVAVHATLGLLLHQALESVDQPPVPLFVVRAVRENDVALWVKRDAIVRIGQILGGEPEVERVSGHELECPARRDRRRAGPERVPVELADERDVTHRELPLLRPEVEVVQRERLLEDRRIG